MGQWFLIWGVYPYPPGGSPVGIKKFPHLRGTTLEFWFQEVWSRDPDICVFKCSPRKFYKNPRLWLATTRNDIFCPLNGPKWRASITTAFLSILWSPSLLSSYHTEKKTGQSDRGDWWFWWWLMPAARKQASQRRWSMVILWSLSAQEPSFHLKGSARDEKGRIHMRSLTRSVFGGLFLLVTSKWKQILQFVLLAFRFSFSIHCSFNSPSFSSITLKCKHRTSLVVRG